MSAILSADDLNDFINPGVACIKPVETLPKQQPEDGSHAYEVTTEEKVSAANPPPAQISLTDCLACSGCVTSAEAVLVSLQSHSEVLDTLDKFRELPLPWLSTPAQNASHTHDVDDDDDGRIFIASVSPQARASLAATYNTTSTQAGHMIAQLLSGPLGLRSSGKHGSGFTWIVDTNIMREACLVAAADEVQTSLADSTQKKPLLTSACPGWICYAEKTHPHILPHLSKMKSPQAMTGTMLKSVLSKRFGVSAAKIWHLAIMPCFDKKLEASRGELTSHAWHGSMEDDAAAVRDVDCVITARELLMLAESRDISFPALPRTPLPSSFTPAFPDAELNAFLFPATKPTKKRKREKAVTASIGTSGGYLHHILQHQQRLHPDSTLQITPGRNADVSEYSLLDQAGAPVFKAARYYGFRNIQNLVRRLKPAAASRVPGAARRRAVKGGGAGGRDEYAYVEVMACPGGCTNGGGQIKVGDVATLRQVGGTGVVNGDGVQEVLPAQREWLERVDEAYWSADESGSEDEGNVEMTNGIDGTDCEDGGMVDGIDHGYVKRMLRHWAEVTGCSLESLIHTTYRVVESDVGKDKASDMERVSALAVAQGGGW